MQSAAMTRRQSGHSDECISHPQPTAASLSECAVHPADNRRQSASAAPRRGVAVLAASFLPSCSPCRCTCRTRASLRYAELQRACGVCLLLGRCVLTSPRLRAAPLCSDAAVARRACLRSVWSSFMPWSRSPSPCLCSSVARVARSFPRHPLPVPRLAFFCRCVVSSAGPQPRFAPSCPDPFAAYLVSASSLELVPPARVCPTFSCCCCLHSGALPPHCPPPRCAYS